MKPDNPSKRAIVVNSVAMRSPGTREVRNDRIAEANPFPKLYITMTELVSHVAYKNNS